MNATKKYYNSNPDNSYSEDANGSCPALYWTDASGNENRVIVIDNHNKLQNRSFEIISIEQRKAVGTDDWLAVPIAFNQPVADDRNYRNLSTGAEVLQSDAINADGTVKAGIVTQATFFIIMVGFNQFNAPVSLYDYFLTAIAQKKNLTIV